MQKGDTIRFRDQFTGRAITGTFRKTHKGNLIVLAPTVSAVGRLPVVTARVVKPEQIIAG